MSLGNPDLPPGYWFGPGPKDDPSGWPVQQVPGGPPFPCPFPQRGNRPSDFLLNARGTFARLTGGGRQGGRYDGLFPSEPAGPG